MDSHYQNVDEALEHFLEQGYSALAEQQFGAAQEYFRKALELNPECGLAYNGYGWCLEHTNDIQQALQSYGRACELEPDVSLFRVNLATLLKNSELYEDALTHWEHLVSNNILDRKLLDDAISSALEAGKLSLASKWAKLFADLTRNQSTHFATHDGSHIPCDPTIQMLTLDKLSHDLQQLLYLKKKRGLDLDSAIEAYTKAVSALARSQDKRPRPLNEDEANLIGDTYGKIWNIKSDSCPTVLFGKWDPVAVQQQYLQSSLGVCVIDDFLSPEALLEIREFCLESTIWFGNRYAHGRLGGFFREGFNNGTLVRVAQMAATLLPDIISDRHPLLQMWAFKYSPFQPATNPHADFAAANLNFWITPDEANLDQRTGGMIIYDVEAPAEWKHEDYNKNGRIINEFLEQNNAKRIYIPYKCNRAILFNSDVFHVTAPLNFHDNYENRRINVTMLYGRRANDAVKVRSL